MSDEGFPVVIVLFVRFDCPSPFSASKVKDAKIESKHLDESTRLRKQMLFSGKAISEIITAFLEDGFELKSCCTWGESILATHQYVFIKEQKDHEAELRQLRRASAEKDAALATVENMRAELGRLRQASAEKDVAIADGENMRASMKSEHEERIAGLDAEIGQLCKANTEKDNEVAALENLLTSTKKEYEDRIAAFEKQLESNAAEQVKVAEDLANKDRNMQQMIEDLERVEAERDQVQRQLRKLQRAEAGAAAKSSAQAG